MSRIAMISEHASPLATLGSTDLGGQNVYVDQVSRGVATLGHVVDVYTRADDPDRTTPFSWSAGVRIIPVVAGPVAPIPKDRIWSHIDDFLAQCRQLVDQHGPYDLIHANFWMSGWIGAQISRERGIPLVQIFHALGAIKRHHQGQADSSPDCRLDVESSVARASERIVAQCPAEVDHLADLYGADRSRIRLVPSGVDLDRYHPVDRRQARRRLGLPENERVVVYVGRLLPRKDVANLIEALARCVGRLTRACPCRLLVVGGESDGPRLDQEPEMRRLMGLAAARGMDGRVSFVGRKPTDELRWYYGAADVFATTPWYEPYGLTPLEAMACGIPVIGSAVGGIAFTVVDGETGFLVPPRQPDQLAELLATILTNDDLRARLGRNARDRVVGTFTWSTVARQTADVYAELTHAAANSTP